MFKKQEVWVMYWLGVYGQVVESREVAAENVPQYKAWGWLIGRRVH